MRTNIRDGFRSSGASGRRGVLVASLVCLAALAPGTAGAVSILFDYRFDTNAFFASPERRTTLERAGSDLAGLFADDLTPLESAGGNAWTARFTNPSSGAAAAVADLFVPEDTLVVFVGARDLGTNTLGFAAPGTASVMGTRDWFDTVQYRGQLGAAGTPATDFGPWGGFVSFDSDAPWHFDISLDGLGAGEFDFYSAAMHELAHVMGFGLSDSWLEGISTGRFTGENSSNDFGGYVPLSPDREHWAEGILSTASGQLQETLMSPHLPAGGRIFLTDLDVAGLRDVGWILVPEPATIWLVLVPLACVLGRAAQPARAIRARSTAPGSQRDRLAGRPAQDRAMLA